MSERVTSRHGDNLGRNFVGGLRHSATPKVGSERKTTSISASNPKVHLCHKVSDIVFIEVVKLGDC